MAHKCHFLFLLTQLNTIFPINIVEICIKMYNNVEKRIYEILISNLFARIRRAKL